MKSKLDEPWYHWRSIACFAYIIICLFDFVIMPIVVQIDYEDTKLRIEKLIVAEQKDRAFVVEVMDRAKLVPWTPLTLVGGGLFHLSFGSLLTGATVTTAWKNKKQELDDKAQN